jgi:predicted ribosomally synthesized peptide with nif11-like leader
MELTVSVATGRIHMSMEALKEFHASARPGTDLEAEVDKALMVGPAAVVEVGARHGFAFTATEVTDLLAEYSAGHELADDQLALVSGGGNPTCNPPADQGSMKR